MGMLPGGMGGPVGRPVVAMAVGDEYIEAERPKSAILGESSEKTSEVCRQ